MLVRVIAPHFVAGLEIEDGVVQRAAPILRYTEGWTDSRTSAYFKSKGWKASVIKGSALNARLPPP